MNQVAIHTSGQHLRTVSGSKNADSSSSKTPRKRGSVSINDLMTQENVSFALASNQDLPGAQEEASCPVTGNTASNANIGEVKNGGCPFKPASQSLHSNIHADADQKETTQQIQKTVESQNMQNYQKLLKECESIEADLLEAELDVRRRADLAFLIKRNEYELVNIKKTQEIEMKKHKEAFEKGLVARSERKLAKKVHRTAIRQAKRRDVTIVEQESASKSTFMNRETLAGKRSYFELELQHMETQQEKQLKQQVAAQDRKSSYEKVLIELEARHLTEEKRATAVKKFQVIQTHEAVLNKRINEQLRERQLLEVRHAKERFELEFSTQDEQANTKIEHGVRLAEFNEVQMDEKHTEKEHIISKREQEKLALLNAQHASETKKLVYAHRIALRQLKIQQDQKMAALKSKLTGGHLFGSSHGGSNAGSNTGSNAGSTRISRQGSASSTGTSDIGDGSSGTSAGGLGIAGKLHAVHALGDQNILQEEDEDGRVSSAQSVSKGERRLEALLLRQKQARDQMVTTLRDEYNELVLSHQAKMDELNDRHSSEMEQLISQHAEEIETMRAIQVKEIAMDQSVHDAEMQMLVERRILNSVLESVVDAIINITPNGTLARFNAAAEKMWGYQASEVIGKNIKMLMPDRYALNHDTYLNNYLTTGIKKVIGSGRRVFGLKKDGTEFPVQLSVSEVKENEEHLFTGIARDLTEEVRIEEENKAMHEAKSKELQDLISQLNVYRKKADDLVAQMLPPSVSSALLEGRTVEPQQYEAATILFLDIVGFTTISSMMKPIETIDLLNSLYNMFDQVIEQYDAYKVETIGDSYMIVSGIPKRNGRRHASEMAAIALHILSVVHTFVYEKNKDIKIRIRMGINTGPVVAGVVGTKMPRYCLFGDTVNTASRMESTGSPMKIQISETTHDMLVQSGGGYHIMPRGEVEVKGKGKMKTYYLTGKDEFPFELPAQ